MGPEAEAFGDAAGTGGHQGVAAGPLPIGEECPDRTLRCALLGALLLHLLLLGVVLPESRGVVLPGRDPEWKHEITFTIPELPPASFQPPEQLPATDLPALVLPSPEGVTVEPVRTPERAREPAHLPSNPFRGMLDSPRPPPPGRSQTTAGAGVLRVQRLKRVHYVAPLYPALPRRNGIEGEVRLEILVDDSGRVSRVTVMASDREDFARAAREAVRQWTYEPEQRGGRQVQALLDVRVLFRLR